MNALNGPASFGWVTRALHWVTAALVLAALGLGLWLTRTEFNLATIRYFGIHKTIGTVVLALVVIRVLWHWFSVVPKPLSAGARWQDLVARWVHRLLYLLLFAMPITGWIASSATDIETVIFNRWTLPKIAPTSEILETLAFLVHGWLAMALIALIALHAGAALFHAIVKRDGTLRRITIG